eukprot:11199439-Karenia_brevis.AAC.1
MASASGGGSTRVNGWKEGASASGGGRTRGVQSTHGERVFVMRAWYVVRVPLMRKFAVKFAVEPSMH